MDVLDRTGTFCVAFLRYGHIHVCDTRKCGLRPRRVLRFVFTMDSANIPLYTVPVNKEVYVRRVSNDCSMVQAFAFRNSARTERNKAKNGTER